MSYTKNSVKPYKKPPISMSDSSNNNCETCGGSGWVMVRMPMDEFIDSVKGVHIYKDGSFETCVSKKCPTCNGGFAGKVNTVKRDAGIPTTFYDKRLDAFDWGIYITDDGTAVDTSSHKKVIENYIEQFETWEKEGMGLYIYSTTKGSGKTFLASCVCNELMSTRAIRTRFVNAADLIEISQSGDKTSAEEYKRNPMKLLYECKFLVIDDLGQRKNSEWLEDILYKLLDERMNNKRMTVITSNVAMANLPYDDRIADRLNAVCIPIHLPEVRIRSKESRDRRRDFLSSMGLI